MPAAGQDSKAAKNTTQPPANGQTPAAPATAENKTPEPAQPEETKQAPAPVKQFDASSLSGRLRPARAADLPEVPSPASASPVTPKVSADGPLPFASLPGAPAAPTAPARTTTPLPAAPAASQASSKLDASGGQIQPAQLISRKEPEYPLLARQMGAKGTVELIATIGPDGAVKAVKVIKGHPLLIKAAQDAVMQWRYRPTLLNGVPVQNDTRITLNFVAQQ
jgi:protein TonB